MNPLRFLCKLKVNSETIPQAQAQAQAQDQAQAQALTFQILLTDILF